MGAQKSKVREVPREVAAKFFEGPHLVTPEAIAYFRIPAKGKRPTFYVELSEGFGLRFKPIYGVAVRGADGKAYCELGTCFDSEAEARAYIEDLAR